jgi:hypothetical protein
MATKKKEEAKQIKEDEVILQQIARESVEPSHFASLYINDVQIQITPWDFRFVLGVIEKEPTKENATLGIKTLGEIRMSPQFAKRLYVVLGGQLKNYEESVGQIPIVERD